MRSVVRFRFSLFMIVFVVVSHHAKSFQRRHHKVVATGSITHQGFSTEGTSRRRSIVKFRYTPSSSVSHSSLAASDLSETMKIRDHPWYSHPDIGRDRSHVQKQYRTLSDIFNRYSQEQQREGEDCDGENDDNKHILVDFTNRSKFILISTNGMWHRKPSSSSSTASPLYLTVGQLEYLISYTRSKESSPNNVDKETYFEEQKESLVAWVGSYQNEDYWVVHLKKDEIAAGREIKLQSKLTSLLVETSTGVEEESLSLDCKPLREFGDCLEVSHDAGILATANGLVEFHKSHSFCSHCGGPTEASKAGGSRTCTIEGCRRSVYPRIDSATIMLVTSPCENYALLGRKKSWPSGRYSTLAGFCEVGETLEECCKRETYEESGVVVDPKSVRFVASQPWPFPRSLMVGFRAKAMASLMPSVGSELKSSRLPNITVDTDEMEDIQWFAKDFVKERLSLSGSTALTIQPNEMEKKFHVPGKASLARCLIAEWTNEEERA
mmetsp:Transcript_29264/g.79179  ORF Transcript_29264/g.79179 Transcript_29264/m.79179 type:complete len:495 (-) Transcript_29264:2377-3861(-)